MRADEQGATKIATLRQSGALKLVFPNTHRTDLEAVTVNTGGGITGGDRFNVTASVGQHARLTITTQAAERVYRAQADEVGEWTTELNVADGAELRWLPQELILFQRSALHRRLNITLAPTAQLLMVEPLVFGRAAMGERLSAASFKDRIRVTRAGMPLYLDGIDLDGDVAAHLAHSAITDGAGAMASLLLVAPDASRHLDHLRSMLPTTAGASLKAPDTLVLRIVAPDSFELRRTLVPLLDHLTENQLPLSWRL